MERKEMVGEMALVLYEDDDKAVSCFGRILAWDDLFLEVQTEANRLVIPNRSILKVKLRLGEVSEDGSISAK